MVGFECCDLVSFPGGRVEITKIDKRLEHKVDLLYIQTEDGHRKVPSTLYIKKLELVLGKINSGQFDHPDYIDLRENAASIDITHRKERFVALTGNRIEIVAYQVHAA